VRLDAPWRAVHVVASGVKLDPRINQILGDAVVRDPRKTVSPAKRP
jgi:hypothetical protein